ncbi:MAG: Dam family site-specific DNA-(adenine-N6)-methyltransferase [Clostridiales bacterium]|jgi:adenine-specific DNA-methyltransferase|nr:Dam family site-specific DNA-(adenine-N6)-methyltransferase [Clostridiales bacterium]
MEMSKLPSAERSILYGEAIPSSALKTTYINNRRYLGSKYKLLPFITSVVTEHCEGVNSVADIFAGTGAVASAFTDKRLITNDNLYSNYICHLAWFSPLAYSQEKIEQIIALYNKIDITQDNYMSETFADTFFSKTDCRKIGFIRDDIERRLAIGDINERERALLITSLLYAADKIANTCGHYDAFRQGVEFDKHLELSVPIPANGLNAGNVCYNEDANELVKRILADLVYIDPPYNSRQYCDAYHLLENIARWEKPSVSGVARKMDRNELKSDYCTKKASKAFENLINNINSRYILLSYNNMAQKGNNRSNAKISDEDIISVLSDKGEARVFTQDYKPFSAGKSDIDAHEERLFLCICKHKDRPIIQSPLNYTGGKFKLLGQILPNFPKRIDTLVDLFCGGCDVGINARASQVIFNDNNKNLLHIYNAFKNLGNETVLFMINEIIDKYGLSRSNEYGYDFYGCDSSGGLANYNRKPFLMLRKDFNIKNDDYGHYIMLYTLIVYAFNNQIRFNSKGEFNLPVGKRDFNAKMKMKLCNFIDRLKSGNYIFSCVDFRKFDMSPLTDNSLVYCDPPYLITCATYNEKDGWNEQCERDLYSLLDTLNERHIKFALSNVLRSKGNSNEILAEWLRQRDYRTIHLDYSYSNANYQTKNKADTADEVLIMNY